MKPACLDNFCERLDLRFETRVALLQHFSDFSGSRQLSLQEFNLLVVKRREVKLGLQSLIEHLFDLCLIPLLLVPQLIFYATFLCFLLLDLLFDV